MRKNIEQLAFQIVQHFSIRMVLNHSCNIQCVKAYRFSFTHRCTAHSRSTILLNAANFLAFRKSFSAFESMRKKKHELLDWTDYRHCPKFQRKAGSTPTAAAVRARFAHSRCISARIPIIEAMCSISHVLPAALGGDPFRSVCVFVRRSISPCRIDIMHADWWLALMLRVIGEDEFKALTNYQPLQPYNLQRAAKWCN